MWGRDGGCDEEDDDRYIYLYEDVFIPTNIMRAVNATPTPPSASQTRLGSQHESSHFSGGKPCASAKFQVPDSAPQEYWRLDVFCSGHVQDAMRGGQENRRTVKHISSATGVLLDGEACLRNEVKAAPRPNEICETSTKRIDEVEPTVDGATGPQGVWGLERLGEE
ncbi:transporter DNA uptake transmembrane protein [Marssonina coronariae]|uniref:Transporter DNA uptake transmembrane protein n=1 Tax=Diplocarpon coronariae TaxID=2795749 RepID=A0A218Z7X1_9HELO|nr:transporter DNA uptake transmembrane protein [Marssonina coronariae]